VSRTAYCCLDSESAGALVDDKHEESASGGLLQAWQDVT
jgi:hypothetical protein